MQFPFWLLIVMSNPDAPSIMSITPFQTELECKTSKAVIEKLPKEGNQRFNVIAQERIVLCEKVQK